VARSRDQQDTLRKMTEETGSSLSQAYVQLEQLTSQIGEIAQSACITGSCIRPIMLRQAQSFSNLQALIQSSTEEQKSELQGVAETLEDLAKDFHCIYQSLRSWCQDPTKNTNFFTLSL
jgi:hypothetical protein